MSNTITKMGDQISTLTLREAAQLGNYLRDAYGIEPAIGAPVVQPGSVPHEVPDEPLKDSFDVVLTGFGGGKAPIIRAVRTVMDWELKQAMQAVTQLPLRLREAVCQDEADAVMAQLEQAGGTVEIR